MLRLKLLEALMDMSRFLLACQKKKKKVLVHNLDCSEVALAADLVVHLFTVAGAACVFVTSLS